MQNQDKTKTVFISCALVVLTLILYWPVRSHDFVNYDDPDYVTENPVVQRGLTEQGVLWAFRSGQSFNWHPVAWISHMLDCQIFGMNPGGHHFTSVLFHALNTLLLFLLLRRMTQAIWKSALVAALFAWHPLHVESVAWICERKDVLSTFFGLLTLWFYLRYVETKNSLAPTKNGRAQFHFRCSMFYVFALIAFAIGLMAKPMLVTLPFVLLLLDEWPLRRMSVANAGKTQKQKPGKTMPFPQLILEKAPFFLLAAAASVVTFLVQRNAGAVAQTDLFPVTERFGNAAVSYIRYLEKTFWPVSLSVFYPYLGWATWQIVGAFFLLMAMSVVVILFRREKPFLLVGWFWFLGTLVPVIGLVQVGTQAMADRYTYIPLIGIFILLVWGWASFIKKPSTTQKSACAVVVGAILMACLFATHFQLQHWRNSETLFSRANAVTKSNLVARVMLGNALLKNGKFDEARIQYEAALELRPDFPEVYFNLGNLFFEQKQWDEAMAYYTLTLQKNPEHVNAHVNLAIVLGIKNDFADAISHYKAALKIEPDDPVTLRYLATDLTTMGKYEEAAGCLKQALALQPGDAEARQALQKLEEMKISSKN